MWYNGDMKNSLAKLSSVLLIIALPALTFAAGLDTFIASLKRWLGALMPIMIGLAVIVFIWGLVVFIAKSGEEEARKEGRQKMIWGVIALFVIVSIWGLTRFVGQTFGIDEKVGSPTDGRNLIPQ